MPISIQFNNNVSFGATAHYSTLTPTVFPTITHGLTSHGSTSNHSYTTGPTANHLYSTGPISSGITSHYVFGSACGATSH
jgi:hypothetical protein